MARKLVWGVALAAVTVTVVFGILFTFSKQDEAKLAKFTSAYEGFDAAISKQSLSEASAALDRLNSAAETKLSSAIKNDGRLMQTEQEITDLSGRELVRLKAYMTSPQSQTADEDALVAAISEITAQRKVKFVHFQELLN